MESHEEFVNLIFAELARIMRAKFNESILLTGFTRKKL